jgi:dipeptidyl aminopeptidase/acylaminoacyl peptidase
LTNRIAYIGDDHQLWVMNIDGTGRRAVTIATQALGGWGSRAGVETNAWPCWSPNARWLACFRSTQGEDSGGPSSLHAIEVDGVEERVLAELSGDLPIYSQWSPDGSKVAILAQSEDELTLQVCALADLGKKRLVDEGAPLFFSWVPATDGLLIHAGNKNGRPSRLMVRQPYHGEDCLYPSTPGSFCTPVFAGGRAFFVSSNGKAAVIQSCAPDGSDLREHVAMDGLVALLPSPDGSQLAVAAAVGGEMTPYDGVYLLPLEGGELRRVVEEPLLAFFWEADGGGLLHVSVDARRQTLWWWRTRFDEGTSRRLAPFWPTREQMFHLHFFEQYAGSHANLTADGQTLIYCGHADPRGPQAGESGPQVFALDLRQPSAPPLPIAAGSFAVAAPR